LVPWSTRASGHHQLEVADGKQQGTGTKRGFENIKRWACNLSVLAREEEEKSPVDLKKPCLRDRTFSALKLSCARGGSVREEEGCWGVTG